MELHFRWKLFTREVAGLNLKKPQNGCLMLYLKKQLLVNRYSPVCAFLNFCFGFYLFPRVYINISNHTIKQSLIATE